jgi:hypothetical protein
MSTREALHKIVDELPESELITAVRILKGLQLAPSALQVLLENAPIDDEPFDEDDLDGGLTEAFEDTQLIPHEEVMRRYLQDD